MKGPQEGLAGLLGDWCTNFWVNFFFVLCFFLCISIGKGRWHHWMVYGHQMRLMTHREVAIGGIVLVFLDNSSFGEQNGLCLMFYKTSTFLHVISAMLCPVCCVGGKCSLS